MESRVAGEVILQVGDIAICLVPDDGGSHLALPGKYLPFSSQASPDIILKVKSDSAAAPPLDRLIYRVQDYWSLGLSGENKVIHRYGALKQPTHALILQPDLRGGEVLWSGTYSDHKDAYALSFPLDALLTMMLLAQGRGVLFHASAVADRDQGFLFVGDSGSGKSTMAGLWRAHAGATLLNDDRVIVRKRQEGFWVYGTPWHKDDVLGSPIPFPLKKVFFIHHAPENHAASLKPSRSAAGLLANSFSTLWDAAGMSFSLQFIGDLVAAVPCYELGFLPDRSVVDLVRCLS